MSNWEDEIIPVELTVKDLLEIIRNSNSAESKISILRQVGSHAVYKGYTDLWFTCQQIEKTYDISIFPTSTVTSASPQNRTADIHLEDKQDGDKKIKQAIEQMIEEKIIKRSYDYAFVMMAMNAKQDLPHFDSPNSFLTYLNNLGIENLPSEDSLKKKNSATYGKFPSWTFNDSKGKDATEALRRINVAKRFISIYNKEKE